MQRVAGVDFVEVCLKRGGETLFSRDAQTNKTKQNKTKELKHPKEDKNTKRNRTIRTFAKG